MLGIRPDLVAVRRTMVDCQVRPSDVTDLAVIEAMLSVPREAFLPAGLQAMAYLDMDIPLGSPDTARRFMIKPAVIARLVDAAAIASNANVLVVGCATGYLAAVVSRIAGRVTASESDPELAAQAAATLTMLGYANMTVVTAPAADGYLAQAPYDAIILDGATDIEPERLYRQLAPAGCLVGIFGRKPQRAMLVRRSGSDFGSRALFDATAPVVPGLERPAAFVF